MSSGFSIDERGIYGLMVFIVIVELLSRPSNS